MYDACQSSSCTAEGRCKNTRTAARPVRREADRRIMRRVSVFVACGALAVVPSAAAVAAPAVPAPASYLPSGHQPNQPNFGSNVIVFSSNEEQSTIQAELDTISAQQVPNQFGAQRYALLFEPGTYGSTGDPLIFQVGYYTEVAGLGAMPQDTVINGEVLVLNQCSGGVCNGTDNFWRSVSNMTINVTTPPAGAPTPEGVLSPPSGDPYGTGCDASGELYAASQAMPLRRVIVNGTLTLQDYCSPTGYVSGGFIADSEVTGKVAFDGQQQYVVRNSTIGGSSNSVWNMVFSGVDGAPATVFAGTGNQYTTLPTSPVTEEEPFLYTGTNGAYRVFVPSVLENSSGTSWASGAEAGVSLPISTFFLASPTTPTGLVNAALARGQNLLMTPGVYDLGSPIVVSRPGTVVMGLGFATLIPTKGNAALTVLPNSGVKVSGLIIDAGPTNSPVLMSVGTPRFLPTSPLPLTPPPVAPATATATTVTAQTAVQAVPAETRPVQPGPGGLASTYPLGDQGGPDLVSDVFFRIGGPETTPVSATVSLLDNADNSILDDIWAWRADHGNAVGWTVNQGATGVVITGNNVTAYGLAVEHYQKYEVVWSGQGGTDIFFQNELPYDPPSQSAWMATPAQDGYPAFLVTNNVRTFNGYGMGSYTVFIDTSASIFDTEAFEVPETPDVQFHDIFDLFIAGPSNGTPSGIDSVINGTGGPAAVANTDSPVDIVQYPPPTSGT